MDKNLENDKKYEAAFRTAFFLGDDEPLSELAYQVLPAWDSVGHMALMAELETAFDIAIDMDDVIDFESYSIGKEILGKYGITL